MCRCMINKFPVNVPIDFNASQCLAVFAVYAAVCPSEDIQPSLHKYQVQLSPSQLLFVQRTSQILLLWVLFLKRNDAMILGGKLKKIYDKRFEFCFGGKIYAKGTHKICKLAKGAKAVYNFNQKICFDGALYDSNYYGTCFGKLIDYRIQFCWEGEIYSKKEYYMCNDKICEKEPAAATTLPPPPVYYAQRRRRRRRRRRKDYNLM